MGTGKQAPHHAAQLRRHSIDLHHRHRTGQPLAFMRREKLRPNDAHECAIGGPAKWRALVGLVRQLIKGKAVAITWLGSEATA